jgi:hypothetical protein
MHTVYSYSFAKFIHHYSCMEVQDLSNSLFFILLLLYHADIYSNADDLHYLFIFPIKVKYSCLLPNLQ